ncbi:MAG: hypothetical protein E7497_03430 [Ruminococcus sp.]|nr:hypothetical protein [Ruminococcus sp.]
MKKRLMILLLAALGAVSCSEKKTDSGHTTVPPVVITSDGSEITLSCGGYNVSITDLNEKSAKSFCKAIDSDFTEETLNNVWFCENIYGVGLASVVYFGKYASKLTENDWKKLEDIAASPEKYADIIRSEDSSKHGLSAYGMYASRIPDSAYFDTMTEEIVCDLISQKNYTRQQAFEFLYSEGIRIETPYSPEIQCAVDEVYSDAASFTENANSSFPQSACVVTDGHGNVLAMAGGNNGNAAYNRAYRTLHPIGSTIKPIAVYAPAFTQNEIHFSSIVPDEPIILTENGTSMQWPSNYNDIYEGNVTVTYALRQSKNTVPVQLAKRIGLEKCFDYMKNILHFSTLTENDCDYSQMAMGYLSQGVRLTELASAYEIFGNGGNYYEPCFYTKVLDSNGNVIIENTSTPENALSSEDAWILNRLLNYNITMEDGIAGAALPDNGCEVYGKTGTVDNKTGNDTDKLFAGGTPDFTAAVWIGFDDKNSTIDNTDYISPAAIWKNIIDRLPVENTSFTADSSVEMLSYCTESGGLASDNCPETEIGYYKQDMLPNECSIH